METSRTTCRLRERPTTSNPGPMLADVAGTLTWNVRDSGRQAGMASEGGEGVR